MIHKVYKTDIIKRNDTESLKQILYREIIHKVYITDITQGNDT